MVLSHRHAVFAWGHRHPLAQAVVLSLLIHLTLYMSWLGGKRLGLWDHQATWLLDLFTKKPSPTLAAAPAPAPSPPPQPKIIPMTFVEVLPSTATETAPEETRFYGEKSSLAANPESTPADPEPQPNVDGSQKNVIRLADNPRSKPFPLQPTPDPPPAPAEPPAPEPPPAEPPPAEPSPGELARADLLQLVKSSAAARTSLPPPPAEQRPRPRTLEQAQAQNPALAGNKLNQPGHVARRGDVAFDVKASKFGSYDAALIRAVEQRWYSLLESSTFVQRSGKVVVEFKLFFDGRVEEMRVLENEVGEILGWLCQRAISDPAPYGPWPSDMRRLIGSTSREVTFTFYYN